MCHRITLIEFHLCTKFGVNSSKFPRTGGRLSNKLFRSWRAQPPMPPPPHHLVSFTIDLHSWSLIGVPIFTSLAQSISKSEDYQRLRYGNHKSIYAGEAYMLPGSLALAARTVWPVGAAKELQVQNICTCTARAQCSPPPSVIRRQVGLSKVHPPTEFGGASSKFP